MLSSESFPLKLSPVARERKIVPTLEPLAALVSLRGRAAVVTGGGGGIGSAIATRLAQAGATVCVADIDEHAADRVVADIVQRRGNAFACHLDVTRESSHEEAARAVLAHVGRLDIWVNNAGLYKMEPLLGSTVAVWEQTMAINVSGVYAGARAAARHMLAGQHGGCIVNVSSVAATRAGHPSMVAYAASKAAVQSLTTNFAAALGPRGIRVVGVAPGIVRTAAMDAHIQALSGAGSNAAVRATSVPLRRLAEPDDIARVVLFLVSDLAQYVTGTTVAVDGGDSTGGGATNPTDELLGLTAIG